MQLVLIDIRLERIDLALGGIDVAAGCRLLRTVRTLGVAQRVLLVLKLLLGLLENFVIILRESSEGSGDEACDHQGENLFHILSL